MLWWKRRISLQEPYNSILTEQHKTLPSSRQLTPLKPTPRLPFSVLDPLNTPVSQSSLVVSCGDPSTPVTGNSTSIDVRMPPIELTPDHTRPISPALKPCANLPETGTTDLYTYNSLNSFSFGTIQHQTTPSSSRPIHPLSTGHGDTDSIGEDSSLGPPDVTPRPSVVAYGDPGHGGRLVLNSTQHGTNDSIHAHTHEHRTGNLDRGGRRSGRDSNISYTGVSSASASVTSLSSTSAGFSRTGSPTSHHTHSTNVTSAAHSSLDDTDDEYDHHHPIPPHIASRSIVSNSTGDGSNTAVEFSSDEDYGDSEYDYDPYEEASGMNIEIGSAQYEGSIVTHDWEGDFYSGAGGSHGSIRGQGRFSYSERRGSIPIAIPGIIGSFDVGEVSIAAPGRNREDSSATIRRPSRSLDDDFAKSGFSWIGSGQPVLEHPLQRSPVSVPGSDGDWRALEERNKSKGKEKETVEDDVALSSVTLGGIENQQLQTATPAATVDGFDLDWAQMKDGITALDPVALGDIIGGSDPASSSDDRRPSAISTRWLSWGNKDTRRPSTATVSSYVGDSFGKAIRNWDGVRYQAQRRDWSFRKERADGTDDGPIALAGKSTAPGPLSPRGSIVTDKHSAFGVATTEPGRELAKQAARDKGSSSSTWKGMRLNSHELWRNDLVGRFKVDRRSQKHADESKGFQQRLMIHPTRDPSVIIPSLGPLVTIHKHSKAAAFSISRHFRLPRKRNDVPPTSSRATDATLNTMVAGASTAPAAKRGSSSMILLAPRRVQVAYTSTNTTRKLESHGLLDDTVVGAPTEVKEKERPRRQREREKQKTASKDVLRPKEQHQAPSEEGSKNKSTQQTITDMYTISRSGPNSRSLPAPPPSAPSVHTYPPSASASSSSLVVWDASHSDRIISRSASHLPRRRRRVRDPLEEDEDEDDENAAPTRTPHSEAFGTMDATLIEQLRQDRPHGESEKGIWNRLLGRGTHSVTASPAQIHAPFVAPWMALQPRNKQESHKGAVNTLNDSFKDVGLLPSNYNASRPAVPTSQRQKKVASSGNNNDPFKGIPEDSLYMLLPLWPGDTDPRSEIVSASFRRPVIANSQRQFLLVYYKVPPEATEEENKKSRGGEGKKRSRISPTSSHDSSGKRDDKASVLLSSFHITARLVPYHKLQGTGVRVPDEGLTVTGPLDIAYEQRPPYTTEESYYEYVIGICHSRDAGIEFYPDGLVKMGLCLEMSTPIQTPTSEEDEIPEPDIKLTPIGRAVLEMVWLGALALTSFGPGT